LGAIRSFLMKIGGVSKVADYFSRALLTPASLAK
jgi:hypothetical protein